MQGWRSNTYSRGNAGSTDTPERMRWVQACGCGTLASDLKPLRMADYEIPDQNQSAAAAGFGAVSTLTRKVESGTPF